MSPEDRTRLLQACNATADNNRRLQRSLRETPAECAKSIEEELSGFLGAVLEDRNILRGDAEATLQPMTLLFDLALLQVCDLSHFALQNHDHRQRVVWQDAVLPKRPGPNAAFYLLTSNLAQSMQAFRLLTLHGFESQARATFRSVVEIFDLMIVALANEHVYRAYITSFDNPEDAYRHWKRNLSPSIVRAALSKIESTDPIVLPIDQTTDEIRKETYSWLSRFVHIDFAAHLVGAHSSNADGTMGRVAMLGTIGEMTKSTLAHGLMYAWVSLLRIERLLWDQHRWQAFRGQRSRQWFGYRCRALDTLFRAYLPSFWEEHSRCPLHIRPIH